MWKKFRNKDIPTPIRVSQPELLESTYDPAQLERAENLTTQAQDSRNYGLDPNIHPPNTTSTRRDIDHVPARLPTMQLYVDTSHVVY